ncbi:MAG: hypothetical protein CVU41_09845 [Chloroflexi bacterium HGW-Chloroflexi-3]|nr:MAG: hypothetical protein CVU41_09845 [Chloroflexi bacterium HGW-Chloroflexi-3]
MGCSDSAVAGWGSILADTDSHWSDLPQRSLYFTLHFGSISILGEHCDVDSIAALGAGVHIGAGSGVLRSVSAAHGHPVSARLGATNTFLLANDLAHPCAGRRHDHFCP